MTKADYDERDIEINQINDDTMLNGSYFYIIDGFIDDRVGYFKTPGEALDHAIEFLEHGTSGLVKMCEEQPMTADSIVSSYIDTVRNFFKNNNKGRWHE